MFDIIRESTVGELFNRFSGGRILPYPDQRPGFEIPKRYRATSSPASSSSSVNEKPKKSEDAPTRVPSSSAFPKDVKNAERDSQEWVSEAPTRVASSDALAHHLSGDKGPTPFDERPVYNHHPHDSHGPHLKQTDTMETAVGPPADVEASAGELEKALEAEIQHGDYILVDWYNDDDPENPRNWSFRKRAFVLFEICLLT